MEENKYKSWCLTINELDQVPLPSKETMIKFFSKNCISYVFQLEKGLNTERLHYQCAFKLKIRRRKSTLINTVKALLLDERAWTFSPMQGTYEEAYEYCTKSETAVEPFVTNLPFYSGADVAFLEDPNKRYPWQEYLFKELFDNTIHCIKTPDNRRIYYGYDPEGASGKSSFCKYLCTNNDSITKLSFGSSSQLRSAIIAAGAKKMYFIDIPRTLGKTDFFEDIISAIEDLKNGFVTSSFYGKNSVLIMDPPHIVIFSNRPCPVQMLSKDRWIQFNISKESYPTLIKNKYDSFNVTANADS